MNSKYTKFRNIHWTHFRWLNNSILGVRKQMQPKLDLNRNMKLNPVFQDTRTNKQTDKWNICKQICVEKNRVPSPLMACSPHHLSCRNCRYCFNISLIRLLVNRLLNQFLATETEFIVYSRILFCTINKFSYGPPLININIVWRKNSDLVHLMTIR